MHVYQYIKEKMSIDSRDIKPDAHREAHAASYHYRVAYVMKKLKWNASCRFLKSSSCDHPSRHTAHK